MAFHLGERALLGDAILDLPLLGEGLGFLAFLDLLN